MSADRMEQIFWALLERCGPRVPRDPFIMRDLWELINDGRIGDAYITARQHDRYEQKLAQARAAMDAPEEPGANGGGAGKGG